MRGMLKFTPPRMCAAMGLVTLRRALNCSVILAVLSLSIGCATTSTLSQPVYEKKPLVMSGTRLDLATLRNEAAVTDRFGVSAPEYPLLDLPFSVVLDFFALGYTVPVALFYRY